MKKYDIDKIKKDFESKDLIMLGEYTGFHNQIEYMTKDGYKGEIAYSHLFNNKYLNLFGARCKYQFENIKLFISRKNPLIEVISVSNIKKSGKHRSVVKMKCECGNVFEKTWEHIYGDKYLKCYSCSRKSTSKKRKAMYDKKHLHLILEQGYKPLELRDNYYANESIEVEELDTGYRGFIKISRKIKRMLVFSVKYNYSNYVYNLNMLIKNNGGNSEALSVVNDDNITIKCGCCGKIFTTTRSRCSKLRFYCRDCVNDMSTNEIKVSEYLKSLGINYIYEFIINSCRDKNPLPFDFYLDKYNLFIEVDGEQHFRPINFGYEDNDIAIKRFEIQQKHDEIKNEYCKKWNIPLLRLSYIDFKDTTYIKKIDKFIQTVQE